MPKLLCLLVITAVGWLSVKADEGSRIIGGQNAVNGQFPHHVHIRNINHIDYHPYNCGGSIIGDRFVLTSSGCFNQPNDVIQDLRVIVGDIDIRANATQHQVDRITEHPHSASSENYIAVVRVTEPFQFSANVRAIQLPTVDLPLNDDGFELPAIFIGWREIQVDGKYTNDPTLQWLNTTVISSPECKKSWGSIRDNKICAKHDPGSGLCLPFAVGGLITRDAHPVLLGLTPSFAAGCPSPIPDLHTRVFPNLAFIRLAMQL